MRTAIEKLRTQDTLRGLILDYRGNGGGILQEAVKIVSMFVPKGTEVVRTKGRAATQENVFRTANDPILPDLPLAVLINGNSASAAEIVAGALQDWDRAVVPSAGIQYPAETHDRQILHSLGALYPGHRLLLAQAGRHGRQGSRFARTGIYDPRRPQSL